mmetsp:Transcript_17593/g.45496  ORF Transcript_17593/g.45496 Transcript_17593/m.45496 type:complete len:219 (-) Transcript_17593:131-787(-)
MLSGVATTATICPSPPSTFASAPSSSSAYSSAAAGCCRGDTETGLAAAAGDAGAAPTRGGTSSSSWGRPTSSSSSPASAASQEPSKPSPFIAPPGTAMSSAREPCLETPLLSAAPSSGGAANARAKSPTSRECELTGASSCFEGPRPSACVWSSRPPSARHPAASCAAPRARCNSRIRSTRLDGNDGWLACRSRCATWMLSTRLRDSGCSRPRQSCSS